MEKEKNMNMKVFPSLFLGGYFLLASCNLVLTRPDPSPTVAPTPTATLTSTPLPPFTPTPLQPMLLVRTEVSCYSGPGDTFDFVANLQAGEKAEIVGKAEAFWIVKLPAEAECWIADEHVNIEGEISALPNITPPLTPTPSAPLPPKNLKLVRANCWVDKTQGPTMYIYEFSLAWTDMSTNEDGFRLYRSGDPVAEVSADTEQVMDKFTTRYLGTVLYYQVVVFNDIGESKSEILPLTCN